MEIVFIHFMSPVFICSIISSCATRLLFIAIIMPSKAKKGCVAIKSALATIFNHLFTFVKIHYVTQLPKHIATNCYYAAWPSRIYAIICDGIKPIRVTKQYAGILKKRRSRFYRHRRFYPGIINIAMAFTQSSRSHRYTLTSLIK